MKKSMGLLFCIMSCMPIRADEQKTALTAYLEKNVKIGMAAAVSICLAYEGYKWYTSPSEGAPQEQGSDGQTTTQEKKLITLNDRIKYFGVGAGYSLLTIASLLATYKCALLALDKAYALMSDPLQEWHDLYDKGEGKGPWLKSGPDWEEGLEIVREAKTRNRLGVAFTGPLAFGIPYLAYVKYRFPHTAFENLKKAFQQ